jgi:serine/threonine protein kinase
MQSLVQPQASSQAESALETATSLTPAEEALQKLIASDPAIATIVATPVEKPARGLNTFDPDDPNIDLGLLVAEGGQAGIYRSTRNGIEVAIKKLRLPTASQAYQLYTNSIRIIEKLSTIKHDLLITDTEALIRNDDVYLVRPWIEGHSLDTLVKASEAEAIRLGIDVASQLQPVHREEIIHRDIKPRNIVRSDRGYHLIDFSIAKDKNDPTTCSMPGTRGYMAPETWELKSAAASDVYSLAQTMIFYLSGKDPEPIYGDVKQQKANEKAIAKLDVSDELKAVLAKATQVDLDQRYKSMAEFRYALENMGTRNAAIQNTPKLTKPETDDELLALYAELLSKERASDGEFAVILEERLVKEGYEKQSSGKYCAQKHPSGDEKLSIYRDDPLGVHFKKTMKGGVAVLLVEKNELNEHGLRFVHLDHDEYAARKVSKEESNTAWNITAAGASAAATSAVLSIQHITSLESIIHHPVGTIAALAAGLTGAAAVYGFVKPWIRSLKDPESTPIEDPSYQALEAALAKPEEPKRIPLQSDLLLDSQFAELEVKLQNIAETYHVSQSVLESMEFGQYAAKVNETTRVAKEYYDHLEAVVQRMEEVIKAHTPDLKGESDYTRKERLVAITSKSRAEKKRVARLEREYQAAMEAPFADAKRILDNSQFAREMLSSTRELLDEAYGNACKNQSEDRIALMSIVSTARSEHSEMTAQIYKFQDRIYELTKLLPSVSKRPTRRRKGYNDDDPETRIDMRIRNDSGVIINTGRVGGSFSDNHGYSSSYDSYSSSGSLGDSGSSFSSGGSDW